MGSPIKFWFFLIFFRILFFLIVKITLTCCEKQLFWWSNFFFEFRGWSPRFCKKIEITRSICSNSQFLKQNTFLTCSTRFLRLLYIIIQIEKIIRIINLQEKLEKGWSPAIPANSTHSFLVWIVKYATSCISMTSLLTHNVHILPGLSLGPKPTTSSLKSF